MASTTLVIVNTRRGFLDHTGIRVGGRIPLSLHHSTDEVTLHQFGAICEDRFVVRFDQVVANSLYGVQSRFCSPGTTNSSASGHRGRTNQTKPRNEATATAEREPIQGQPRRRGGQSEKK